METYEQFAARNAAFGGGGFYNSEKTMKANYEIAKAIIEKYESNATEEPRLGDIVEFSDGFQVYTHAKITEDVYRLKEHGLMCVCENGSSWTDGVHFSTSGGAFRSIHKSRMQLVGEETNMVWTWGCFGAGASMGIYFPLKVRKWLVPYEPIQKRSSIDIRMTDKENRYKVSVRNFGDWYCAMCFKTIKAFNAWAEYVGYKHESNGHGSFHRDSPQRIVRKYVCHENEIPKDGKPLKTIDNGRVRDSWVVTTDELVTIYVENFKPYTMPKFGTVQSDIEIAEFWKYDGNPMGV